MASGRPMDRIEAHAREYLQHRGHAKIVHHPAGAGSPPDFLVDDRIAVEVRRLNQNYVTDGETEGLEEQAIRLWTRMKKLVAALGPPTSGESWFVRCTYRRPLEDWRTLRPKLRLALESFKLNPDATDEVAVGGHFKLDFGLASKPHGTFFVFGGALDLNAGGFMVGELVTNIQLCIVEKTAKTLGVHSKYSEWWLVLVNRIDSDFYPSEWAEIRAHVSIPASWSKVILVSGADHTDAIEL